MSTLYVLYYKNGDLRKGVISSSQYDQLKKDSTISDLTTYPSESYLQEAYNSAKGINSPVKKILLG